MEIIQWMPRQMSQNQNIIRIIYADMEDVMQEFSNQKLVAFAHCISADFESERHMSAGVSLAFRDRFGRPTVQDCLSSHLTFQQAGEAGVYGLVTKPKFYQKPRESDYDQAFNELIVDVSKKGYRHLICSPMGCVRDYITIEKFLKNVFDLQHKTGVSVSIVTHSEQSRGRLWNGLKYKDFLRRMRTFIEAQYQKCRQPISMEVDHQQEQKCGLKMEILQWIRREMSQNQYTIRIIYADMEDVIQEFSNQKLVAFAHCISADFEAERHMSAGVSLAFRIRFGRPTVQDCLSSHLTFQQAGYAGVYGLVTKPKFYQKPRESDYDQAFNELIVDVSNKGYRHLICSPMGCVRDYITIEKFLKNVFDLQHKTGVSVSIVTHSEQSRGRLWNGLKYKDFLRRMRTFIEAQYQKCPQPISMEVDHQQEQQCGLKMEILQWIPREMSQNQNTLRIIYAYMEDVIQEFSNQKLVFAHCISADFESERHMSAGVSLAFRDRFGRPTVQDCLSSHLTFQQAGYAGVYGLVTKPKFYQKAKKSDYDQAFNELIVEVSKKGYRHLICSPMGCVRDHITIETFLKNVFDLQQKTGVSVSIVTHIEQSRGKLWNGLKYKDFLRQMRIFIETQYKKCPQPVSMEIDQ